MFEMQVYIPLCDVCREENVISTVRTIPLVTCGDTAIPSPLTWCPFGSNHFIWVGLSLVTVQVREYGCPAEWLVYEVLMLTEFSSSVTQWWVRNDIVKALQYSAWTLATWNIFIDILNMSTVFCLDNSYWRHSCMLHRHMYNYYAISEWQPLTSRVMVSS